MRMDMLLSFTGDNVPTCEILTKCVDLNELEDIFQDINDCSPNMSNWIKIFTKYLLTWMNWKAYSKILIMIAGNKGDSGCNFLISYFSVYPKHFFFQWGRLTLETGNNKDMHPGYGCPLFTSAGSPPSKLVQQTLGICCSILKARDTTETKTRYLHDSRRDISTTHHVSISWQSMPWRHIKQGTRMGEWVCVGQGQSLLNRKVRKGLTEKWCLSNELQVTKWSQRYWGKRIPTKSSDCRGPEITCLAFEEYQGGHWDWNRVTKGNMGRGQGGDSSFN